MTKVPYTILPSKDKGKIYKPLVKVILNYKKTHKVTLPVIALIDSGADCCFCADYIGTWLGIQFDKIKSSVNFTAVNGQTFVTKSEVLTLMTCEKKYECRFHFSDILPRETPIILGQLGFFDHFKIKFDAENATIEID
jgi:hypothetical protein